MDKKKLIGILIMIFGVAMLAVIIYFLFFYQAAVEEPPVTTGKETAGTDTNTLVTDNKEVETKPVTSLLPKREFGEIDLKIMASSFAERFGSFSNQSDFGNIRDLKIFMSRKMSAWADDYIRSQISKQSNSSIYYGITTKAISGNIKAFDPEQGSGSVMVSTQRRESTGTADNSTRFSQDILLNFVKEDGLWKVDNAFWQDR